MLGRAVGLLVLACVLSACLLLTMDDARAGDEDFFGIEGRPVALNVTVDPGSAVDKWWWDFQGDGCFTWSSAVGPNTTHVYPEPGLYYPVLKATNDTVMVKTWIFLARIVPENEPPTITMVNSYEDGWRYYPLFISAHVVDDGEVVLYEWDFDGDGVFDWNSTEGPTVEHEFTKLGNFTGVLRVTDDQGATTSVTTTFIIKNLAPVIDYASDVQHSTERIIEEIEMTFTPRAHDPDGEVLLYEWDFGDGSEVVTTSSPNITHTYRVSDGMWQSWYVRLTVHDADGGNSTTNLWAKYHLHYWRPSVHTDGYVEAFVGEVVEFSADVTPGSMPVTRVAWDLDGDGTFESEGANHSHVYDTPGHYRTKVRVWDTEDNYGEWSRTVNVTDVANLPPVAVPSVEQWVLPGRNLRFSDASFDPDGTIVLWQWDVDGDGTYDNSDTSHGNYTHVYVEEGVYIAVLRVTDNRGEVAVATVTIKVDREAPGEDPVDDAKGAAVCCGVVVVILVVVAYWAVRRTMDTPRKDGGRAGPPEEEDSDPDPDEDPEEESQDEPDGDAEGEADPVPRDD
jgi:PKD repeat protein